MNRRSFLITGAGTGIGRAISVALAARGDRIIALGRTETTLTQTLEDLEGDGHVICTADIRSREELDDALGSSDLTGLSGIIANAGVGGENVDGTGDRWHEIIDTNLTGTYNSVMAAKSKLSAPDGGYSHIILTSSILARLGVPGYSAYCASKAGMLGLMRSWCTEFAADNILVNAICPGWVETSMALEGLQAMADATGRSLEDTRAEQMGYVLLGKMSTPEEIGNFVAWLTSDEQTSITGQALDINNGALMPS